MKFELTTPIDKSISIKAQKINAIVLDFSTGLLQVMVGDYENIDDVSAYETRTSETALNVLSKTEQDTFSRMAVAAMTLALKDGTLQPGHSVGDPYVDLPDAPPPK